MGYYANDECSLPATAAPGTPPPARLRPSRSASAAAGGRARSPSPNSSKLPWVVADWKRRVPEPTGTSPGTAAGAGAAARPSLRTSQAAAAVTAEKKRQLAVEFAGPHQTIERMLARCKLVQDTLHVSSSSRSRCSADNSSWQPATPPRPASAAGGPSSLSARASRRKNPLMHLTMRSHLLFEAPASSADSDCQQQLDAHEQQQHAHRASWSSAVDLNPGFAFRPGTPERMAAVMRHAGSQAAAPAAPVVPGPQVCSLTHREKLQAGLAELTGAFYSSLRQEQWLQHQEQLQRLGWQQADVVPLTWFVGL